MRQAQVFVVDDEEQICSLLTRILQKDGLRVRPFRSADEALDAVASDAPDLVITDMMMPGVSGLELAQRVKAIRPATSVVVITGYASLENVVDALRTGVDDFVTKPFGVSEIRAVVQRVLGDRAQRTEPVPTTAEIVAGLAAEPGAPAVAATAPAPEDALARRLRDVALLESVHGLLGEELESRDLADRAVAALLPAVGVTRCAVLAADGDRFVVASARSGVSGDVVDSDALRSIAAPASVASADLGAVAARLDRGPAAAAPLRPREPRGEDAGLLVVSRPEGGASFEGEDLRVLGVAASAIGDVFHAVRAAERAEQAYVASLLDVVAATERRASWFLDHSVRVRDLSVRLGRHLGLASSELEVLEIAARLLDLGRLELHDELLAKTGRLSPDEWRALRHHPEVADALVRPLGRLRAAKPVIRHHHENWDGSGYPDGLRGDDIPFLASLVRITDAYAALTSARPWREAVGRDEALRRLVAASGTHFHPHLVPAFAEVVAGGAGDGA